MRAYIYILISCLYFSSIFSMHHISTVKSMWWSCKKDATLFVRLPKELRQELLYYVARSQGYASSIYTINALKTMPSFAFLEEVSLNKRLILDLIRNIKPHVSHYEINDYDLYCRQHVYLETAYSKKLVQDYFHQKYERYNTSGRLERFTYYE